MKESSDKSKPQSLEELFRAKMEVAEETPSDRVWERIEQGLNLKEAGYYKERVSWYKSMAAACLALVVCAAMYLYYDVNTQHGKSGTELATLSQTQRNAELAGNKSSQASENSSSEKQIIVGNPVAKPSINPTEATITDGSLATNAQTTKNNFGAGNLPNSRVRTQTGFNNSYANAQSGVKKRNRRNGYPPTNSSNTNNFGTAAGEVAFIKNGEATFSATEDMPASDLEPLQSVKTWAGLSKKNLSADSLWKPRAIEAAPPALALISNPAREPEKPRLARWSFSARYAPQYFNQNLELASAPSPQYLTSPGYGNFSGAPAAAINTSGYTQALNEFDKNTGSGYSYNTAVAAGYALNEHWSVETGLLFTQNVANSQSSYVFNNSYLAARYNSGQASNFNDTRHIGQAAVLPTTALVASLSGQQNLQNSAVIQIPTFDTQYRYRSVGVPVKLNYQTKSRKSFYFASVGLLTNLLVQAQILSESSRVPDIKFGSSPESPFRTWQFATVLSAGKGYRLSKALSLRAGLEGTQYLTSLAAHPENLGNKQRKPYTIGVAFSSSYTLGK